MVLLWYYIFSTNLVLKERGEEKMKDMLLNYVKKELENKNSVVLAYEPTLDEIDYFNGFGISITLVNIYHKNKVIRRFEYSRV